MKRKMGIGTACVAAVGLLVAIGAAARRSGNHPLQSSSGQAQSGNGGGMRGQGMMGPGMMAGQGMAGGQMMGQGMTEQNRTARRANRERLMGELLENQAFMEKARSLRALEPLLKKNRALLEQLRDEMRGSGQMPGQMMRNRMTGPSTTARTGPTGTSSRSESRPAATGRRIFQAQGCIACHGRGGVGTASAPSLLGVGKKFSSTQLAELIRHPRTAQMPSYPLSDAEMKALIAYLQSLR
jgi:mono/diheme cytochrome c family protein